MKTTMTKAEILSKCKGESRFSEALNTVFVGTIPFTFGATWDFLMALVGDVGSNDGRNEVTVETADGATVNVVWNVIA